MCYDISFKTEGEILKEYFAPTPLSNQLEFHFISIEHMQAQAHMCLPVIFLQDGKLVIRNFEWGVIAEYMNSIEKVKKQRSSMCNARAEKLLDKSSYWHRIRNNRCLIPVTGIFEHRGVKGFKNKIPYHVRWRNRKMFCIPGLYNYSNLPDPETGEQIGTFTIVTTEANELMSYIHNDGENKHRMPLFLTKELELEWLKDDITDDALKEILNFRASSEDLECWTVSTIRTNKQRPDGKMKFEPFEWKDLPPFGKDDVTTQQTLF
jgi:putative SOS response-associated peptidase YedK